MTNSYLLYTVTNLGPISITYQFTLYSLRSTIPITSIATYTNQSTISTTPFTSSNPEPTLPTHHYCSSIPISFNSKTHCSI